MKLHREHGYQAGDVAIQTVASIIIKHVRKTDLVSHWGGDEFAVLLYDTTYAKARDIAERTLAHINELGYQVSIGIGNTLKRLNRASKPQRKGEKTGVQFSAHHTCLPGIKTNITLKSFHLIFNSIGVIISTRI